MVTMYIGGGLANKMFQYAFSLAIKKKGYDVVYDTVSFKTEFVHDRVELDDIFTNVKMNKVSRVCYWAAGKQGKLQVESRERRTWQGNGKSRKNEPG